MTSQTRWCSPCSLVSPMYMLGRTLRRARKPALGGLPTLRTHADVNRIDRSNIPFICGGWTVTCSIVRLCRRDRLFNPGDHVVVLKGI